MGNPANKNNAFAECGQPSRPALPAQVRVLPLDMVGSRGRGDNIVCEPLSQQKQRVRRVWASLLPPSRSFMAAPSQTTISADAWSRQRQALATRVLQAETSTHTRWVRLRLAPSSSRKLAPTKSELHGGSGADHNQCRCVVAAAADTLHPSA